jgi:hypothetical protein
MIVDMVSAETVVARAAGAVTEFQIRVFRIRPAAYRALMVVELILLFAADAG